MLSETVRQFYEEGGRHLFLDNVHRYGSWVQAIECLHDDYPDMQIVFAAPLLVEGEKTEMPFDGKGDWYTLHTMSFREYLSYEGALDLKPVPLDELLLNHAEVTQQVMDEVNIVPISGIIWNMVAILFIGKIRMPSTSVCRIGARFDRCGPSRHSTDE